MEFESLQAGMQPDSRRVIMQSSSAVSYLLREGSLKVPGFPGVINLETPEEILSDKLRALLERGYTKGRDFFDVWYLTRTMGLKPEPERLRRKLEMYRAPFRVHTPASFYAALNVLPQREKQGLVEALRKDLARFIGTRLGRGLRAKRLRGPHCRGSADLSRNCRLKTSPFRSVWKKNMTGKRNMVDVLRELPVALVQGGRCR